MPCVPMLSSLRIIVIQVRVVPDLILVLLVARVAESVAAYHRVTHIQNTSCFVHWPRGHGASDRAKVANAGASLA